MGGEFLPLCDVLFNVISLAGYFCDVVFDVVLCYALLDRGYTTTAAAALTIILSSLLISQVVSLRWYLHVASNGNNGSKKKGCSYYAPHVLHLLQLGVLWRYAKLFVPVDLRYVKHEVRNLCMLRLVHAFCEAAPMLLLQLHVLAGGLSGKGLTHSSIPLPSPESARPILADDRGASAAFTELNVISASLSLFSVCWALASFSKNVRLQNVHRLVLTWLGVIFQFAWRLGTISARVTALTVYASLYEHWVFLVIGLHWVSMFLWLISPKNVFHGERISRPRKAYLSALIAFVYVFAYVNLQEVNHRQKMLTFYIVMLVENCLLVCVWVAGVWGREGDGLLQSRVVTLPFLVLASFFAGIGFMLLYYRYFHVRRLGYELGGRLPLPANGDNKLAISQYGNNCYDGPQSTGNTRIGVGTERPGYNAYHVQRAAIPGVFNCRFTNPVGGNAATKRKKKKPTSFIPPPAAPPAPLRAPRPAPLPFWRRPLPAPHNHSHCGGSSENEGSSIGSRVNIHQKLQEKKQKQLAELKIIEEEIKQGKLANNAMISGDEIYSSLQRQPIPRTKKHIDLEPLTWAPPSPELGSLGQSFENLNALGQTNHSQSPKMYDGMGDIGLLNSGNQNNGYENFSGFSQNTLAASNLIGQFLGSFPSYTEIPSMTKNSSGMSPINIPGNYESINQNSSNNRNMSPSSQISNGDQNNSLTRQILPRSKNPRQFISNSNQHRQNAYQADLQRSSEQSRLLYSESSPRTVLQNNDSSRIQRLYPENAHIQRLTNFLPESVSRNMSFENNSKSISPRNITNMSPRNVFTETGSATNSYERKNNGQVNRLIDNVTPRQMNQNNYNEGQNHGHQYSGVYTVSNQDTLGLELLSNTFNDGRHNFASKTPDQQNKHSDSNTRRSPAYPSENSNLKASLGYSYQMVPPPKSKLDRSNNLSIVEQARKMQRCKTPEILLAPHFLENASRQSCCHWGVPYRGVHDDTCHHADALSSGEGEPGDLQGPCRAPSDIDSQISLPRSYTLPREFKYYRRNRQRRIIRPDHFIASTNSSDGDVDSGDDNESERLSSNLNKSQMNQVLNSTSNQQSPNKPFQHQHSVSQPSSSHFQDSKADQRNKPAKIEPRQQLSCQNISIYDKMETNVNGYDDNDDNILGNHDDSISKHNDYGSKQNSFDDNSRYNGNDRQAFYTGVSPAHGRQMRNRMYGMGKLGAKHETKL